MGYKSINKSKCYCTTLSRAANAVNTYYDEAFEKFGITSKQYSLLMNLSRLGEANTVELADFVNLERTTLSRNLKVLFAKGWIEDLAQGKVHRYALTQKGAAMIEQVKPVWETLQTNMELLFGTQEMQDLLKKLHGIQVFRDKW